MGVLDDATRMKDQVDSTALSIQYALDFRIVNPPLVLADDPVKAITAIYLYIKKVIEQIEAALQTDIVKDKLSFNPDWQHAKLPAAKEALYMLQTDMQKLMKQAAKDEGKDIGFKSLLDQTDMTLVKKLLVKLDAKRLSDLRRFLEIHYVAAPPGSIDMANTRECIEVKIKLVDETVKTRLGVSAASAAKTPVSAPSSVVPHLPATSVMFPLADPQSGGSAVPIKLADTFRKGIK